MGSMNPSRFALLFQINQVKSQSTFCSRSSNMFLFSLWPLVRADCGLCCRRVHIYSRSKGATALLSHCIPRAIKAHLLTHHKCHNTEVDRSTEMRLRQKETSNYTPQERSFIFTKWLLMCRKIAISMGFFKKMYFL